MTNNIWIQELNQQNNMLPVSAALFELAMGTAKLLESQDKDSKQFLGEYMETTDKNESLTLIIGTLEELEDSLVDFCPIPCGLPGEESWGL